MKKYLITSNLGVFHTREVLARPAVLSGAIRYVERSDPPTQEEMAEMLAAPPVPAEVANWRARVILKQQGLLDQVAPIIAALDEPLRTLADEAWRGRAPLSRYGAMTLLIATELGRTTAQLDEMFIAAAAIDMNTLPT